MLSENMLSFFLKGRVNTGAIEVKHPSPPGNFVKSTLLDSSFNTVASKAIPALGCYNSGQLNNLGISGYYWSSSANPSNSSNAYNLYFNSGNVNVNNNHNNGFVAQPFE